MRLKQAIAQARKEAAQGLVHGTKDLDKTSSAGRRVFVRCADDTSVQPWPLPKAIANVAAITGDMDLMERHGLLDPTSEQHPLFSLDQMKRLYEARCADCKRTMCDERLARFCETLGNFACGEQFVMRESKFESHSIRAICEIFKEGGMPASISHLDLSGNNLGAAGGRLIAEVLPKLTELCVLRLGSANLGDGIAAIASALRDSHAVTHLDLSATHCGAHRNCIIGDTVRVLSTMLRRNRVLAHINLSNTSIKQNGPTLLDSMAMCKTLVHVHLRDNGLEPDCSEALSKMVSSLRHLETLDLAENHLDGPSIELLCRTLAARKATERERAPAFLKYLDLSKNRIDAAVDSAVQALCAVLETHGIRRLVLSDNNLCRAGYDPLEGTRLPPTTELVSRIFKSASKPSSGVEWLEMANCGFATLPETIHDLLYEPATLQRLDLSRNNLRDVGAEVLAEGLARPDSNLLHCDISQNNMTTAGARHIARALRTNRTLRHLRCYNGARMDEITSGLVEAVAGHKRLETVDLQKACMVDVQKTLERNRSQRSKDSLPQADRTREKTGNVAKQTADMKEQVKEERHRLDNQLDVLKIMRERAKTMTAANAQVINTLTNEAIEWRSNYDEMITQHKELHEELLAKQQRMNRVLEDATRNADREVAEKNTLLCDAWLVHAMFDARGFARCSVAPPSLPPPGSIRSRLELIRSGSTESNPSGGPPPEDEEVVLEQQLEKLLAQIAEMKSTCDIYHRNLLNTGVVTEEEIAGWSVVPKSKRVNEEELKLAEEQKAEQLKKEAEAAEAEQLKKKAEAAEESAEAASKRRGAGGAVSAAAPATSGKPKPKSKRNASKPVRARK